MLKKLPDEVGGSGVGEFSGVVIDSVVDELVELDTSGGIGSSEEVGGSQTSSEPSGQSTSPLHLMDIGKHRPLHLN